MPASSPSSAHSSALRTSVSSASSAHGRGSWSSKNIPNCMGSSLGRGGSAAGGGAQEVRGEPVDGLLGHLLDQPADALVLVGQVTGPGQLGRDHAGEVDDRRVGEQVLDG